MSESTKLTDSDAVGFFGDSLASRNPAIPDVVGRDTSSPKNKT